MLVSHIIAGLDIIIYTTCANRSTSHVARLLSHRSSHLLSSTSSSSSSWSSLPRVDLFVGGFATHLIALPSVLRAASSLLRPAFTPPPVCCGATHPLPRRQPLVEDYAHDLSLSPPATSCSSRLHYLLVCARASFIYSVNSRTNTTGSVTMSAPFVAAR